MLMLLFSLVTFSQESTFFMEIEVDSVYHTKWDYSKGEYIVDTTRTETVDEKIYIFISPEKTMISYDDKLILPDIVTPYPFVTIFQEGSTTSEFRYALNHNSFSEYSDYKSHNSRYEVNTLYVIKSIKFLYKDDMLKILENIDKNMSKENKKKLNKTSDI